jgi:Variant SH3 domain
MPTSSRQHTAVAEADYRASTPNPILLKVGQVVQIDREDDEYPGWYWCEDSLGHTGWVWGGFLALPEHLPGKGHTTVAYSAVELSVLKGEALTVLYTAGGWAWCRTHATAPEEGWLPETILQITQP